MTITYKQGNAVDALINGEIDVLLHVCNNKGVMGSGIALEIKNRIPDAYQAYKNHELVCGLSVGDNSYAWLDSPEDSVVVNMIAQNGYGSGKRFLNYGALANCLCDVRNTFEYEEVKAIGIPFKMGSDRAGGDWNIVLEMVEYFLKDFNVIVYKL